MKVDLNHKDALRALRSINTRATISLEAEESDAAGTMNSYRVKADGERTSIVITLGAGGMWEAEAHLDIKGE